MTSEEIALAAADLATVAALRAELEAAQSIIAGQRRAIASMQKERDTLYAELEQWRTASTRLLAVDASALSYEILRNEIRLMRSDDRVRLWAYPSVSALLGDVAAVLEGMKKA